MGRKTNKNKSQLEQSPGGEKKHLKNSQTSKSNDSFRFWIPQNPKVMTVPGFEYLDRPKLRENNQKTPSSTGPLGGKYPKKFSDLQIIRRANLILG